MGTGARYYRAALGQSMAEAEALQKHQLAMIPITEKQAESELELQKKALEFEKERIETLTEVISRAPGMNPQQIVYAQQAPPPPEKSFIEKNLNFIVIGVIAWLLFLR